MVLPHYHMLPPHRRHRRHRMVDTDSTFLLLLPPINHCRWTPQIIPRKQKNVLWSFVQPEKMVSSTGTLNNRNYSTLTHDHCSSYSQEAKILTLSPGKKSMNCHTSDHLVVASMDNC